MAGLEWGRPATVLVRFQGVRSVRMRRGTLRVEAVAADETGSVRVVWHNRYPSFAKALAGSRAALYGVPVASPRGEMRIENPETEFIAAGEEADPVHSGRIVGIHHRGADVSPRLWRTLARRALDRLETAFEAAAGDSAGIREALEEVHFPASPEAAEAARGLLAREELLVLAAGIEEKRARLHARRGVVLAADDTLRERARRAVPFPLTGAQKRAVREISADLASGRAMARLLQGDVGSGKTVVAGLALLLAAGGRVQGALMAPTEILAEQHAESLASWLTGAGVRLALLTGRVRGEARRRLLAELASGRIDVLVGTHALAEAPVEFRRLGLVVVDEQHRFGVAHRARLFRKGDAPHVLVMTATPIPRSLAWAIYGELDVSVLDEKPPGRGEILTRVRDEEARAKVYRFAGERAAAGERVYVVVPAIEEGEREVAATRDTADRLAAVVPSVRIGVLHGRMPARRAHRRASRLRERQDSDSRLDDGRRGRRGRAGGDVHDRRERRGLRPRPAPPAARTGGPKPTQVLVRPDRRPRGDARGPGPPRGSRSDFGRIRHRGEGPRGARAGRPSGQPPVGTARRCAWPIRSATSPPSARPGAASRP